MVWGGSGKKSNRPLVFRLANDLKVSQSSSRNRVARIFSRVEHKSTQTLQHTGLLHLNTGRSQAQHKGLREKYVACC